MKPAAPSPAPMSLRDAKSAAVSNFSSGMTGPDTPQSAALKRRPGRGPPATSSKTRRSDTPASSSNTPGRATSPLTVKISVPGVSRVPSAANEAPPRRTMLGTCANVWALLTSAGFGEAAVAKRPRS
jgi:hypothetical protein